MSRRRTVNVFVDGILTPVKDIRTDHGVDQPVATGSITMRAPRPPQVDLAAPVRIEAGYDGQVFTIFDGRVANQNPSFGESGGTLRVALEGRGKQLWYRNYSKITIFGPITLKEMFRSLCMLRGIKLFFANDTTYPTGGTVTYGGLAQVNGGNIIIPKRSSPGSALDRWARNFGYRVYDLPNGVILLKKISGLPVGDPFRAFVEGVNVLDVAETETLEGMVNYWEVFGAEYQATDGSEVAIRSFPATVPFDARLGPDGVSRDEIRDGDIINAFRADQSRNVQELDRSAPSKTWSWTGTGDPELAPGQVVSLASPTVNADMTPVPLWLTHMSHAIPEKAGWTTAMEGWSGGGTALPAGNDCTTIQLTVDTGHHLGNQYLSYYRRPTPNAVIVTVPFTVPYDYSTLTIRGYAHGCNNIALDTSTEDSHFEVWQAGVSVASGSLPRFPELERPYGASPPFYLPDGSVSMNPWYYWKRLVIPLSGSLTAGSADLKIISGIDSETGDRDDFEVSLLSLTACGVGVPIII